MTNSDYLFKAVIKKVSEKVNEVLIEKFEEAANIAKDAPEIIKKEFDILKESIIEEAARMEYEMNSKPRNKKSKTYQDPKINKALEEIIEIQARIERLDKKMNNFI